MHYQVTFQLAGEERTESVDARDAATAVSKIQFDFGRTDELFELISVQVDEAAAEEADAASPSENASNA
jgi:hypothetical protein